MQVDRRNSAPDQIVLGDFNLKPDEPGTAADAHDISRRVEDGRRRGRRRPVAQDAHGDEPHRLTSFIKGDGVDDLRRWRRSRRRRGSAPRPSDHRPLRCDDPTISCVKITSQLATCPKCMGALTEHHRCPRGPLASPCRCTVDGGRRRAHRDGGAATLFDERPVPALVMAAAALGAVLTSAVRQAVSGRGLTRPTRSTASRHPSTHRHRAAWRASRPRPSLAARCSRSAAPGHDGDRDVGHGRIAELSAAELVAAQARHLQIQQHQAGRRRARDAAPCAGDAAPRDRPRAATA